VLPTQVFEAWRPSPQIIGCFPITRIDADADCNRFVLWWQQNDHPEERKKSLPAIAGGLLLWADDLQKLKRKIRDQDPVMSGYEPLNPNGDPRVPKSMSARVTQPGPTDEMADRLLPTEK
jgi:hypothetical protein